LQAISRRPLLQRLFSAFPAGLPGIGLLLLRGVAGVAVAIQGAFYLADHASVTGEASFIGLLALVTGAALLVGFMTPVAALVTLLGGLANWFSLLPVTTPNLFNTQSAVVFAIVMMAAVALLGPGAYSVDARLFGRREIIIPPPSGLQK